MKLFLLLSAFSISTAPVYASFVEQTVTYKVKGMSCEGCEGIIADKLEEVQGVKSVVANHKTGEVTIVVSQPGPVDKVMLAQAIENAGHYTVVNRPDGMGPAKAEKKSDNESEKRSENKKNKKAMKKE